MLTAIDLPNDAALRNPHPSREDNVGRIAERGLVTTLKHARHPPNTF